MKRDSAVKEMCGLFDGLGACEPCALDTSGMDERENADLVRERIAGGDFKLS